MTYLNTITTRNLISLLIMIYLLYYIMYSTLHKPIIPPPLSPTKTKQVDLNVASEELYDTITESAYALIEFETATSKWYSIRPKGIIPNQRSNHSAILYNGMLYLFGGNELNSDSFSDLWSIDISNIEDHIAGKISKEIVWNQLEQTGDKPGKVSNHGAIVYKDQMIIYGGTFNYINSEKCMFNLNLKTLEWKAINQKGIKPSTRDEHSVVLYNDSLLVFGGSLTKGAFANDLWVYSIQSEEWKKIESTGPQPMPRSGHSACILEADMYIFGGLTDENKRCNDLWVCHLSNYQWEEVKVENPPKARSYHSMNTFEGKIYIFGGLLSITQELNDVYSFDPADKKWVKQFDTTLTPRAYHSYQMTSVKKESPKKQDQSPHKEIGSNNKEPNNKELDLARNNLITPMTQRMMNSPLIEHCDKSFDVYYQQLKKKKKALQGMSPKSHSEQEYVAQGYFPCVRSSHRTVISNTSMVVVAGDKHQMPLNDLFILNLK